MKTVLFLCTGNSARSILAEVIFNECFSEHGKAVSAGSKPTGIPNPFALKTLEKHGHSLEGLQSQNITEFQDHDIDILISVCDNAQRDCPVWPGKNEPERIHWGLPDPAAVNGTDDDILKAFEKTYQDIYQRIEPLVQGF